MIRLINKYLIIILITLSSCTPDPLPTPNGEQPVFTFSGLLDGDSMKIAAGINDYFLDSYFEKDNLDIYTFKGTFRKANCNNNCTEELTISIRDRKIMDEGANFIRDLSLRTGDYFLDGGQLIPEYLLQSYQFVSNNVIPSNIADYEYLWIFNGVDSSKSAEPVFYFPEIVGQTVELKITDPVQSCMDFWQNEVILPAISFVCPNTTFIYDNNSGSGVYFILPYLNEDIISSNWNFGDGNSMQFGSEAIVEHIYSTPGTYEVCVEAVLQGGCSDSFCSRIQSHSGNGCAAGFDYHPPFIQSHFFSNAIIDWVSEDGKVYSSFNTSTSQPESSYFIVTDITPFDDDLDGEKTMKIVAMTKLTLFNKDDPSDKMVLESDNLIFAVAYPDL